MQHPITIAIDGFSGCGKSTLARQLAGRLHYLYIDTGAMYRAITLYFLNNHIDGQDARQLSAALKGIQLAFSENPRTGRADMILNGQNVEEQIRSMRVTGRVSEVAALPAVRQFAVAVQQQMGAGKGVVLEGRDVGTVVFPDAELKIFLTADPAIRVERRLLELRQKDPTISREAVQRNLEKRDYTDTHRKDGPLRQAEDAVVLDNSHLSPEQQLEEAYQLAQQRLSA